MKQLTTPKQEFTFPFVIQEGTEIRIVYAQKKPVKKEVAFVKTNEDCVIFGDTITVTLTQEETYKLDPEFSVLIDPRICTATGEVPEIETIVTSVKECFDDCIMGLGGDGD